MKKKVSAVAALAALAGSAVAQGNAPPDPTALTAPAARPAYASVFAGYRPSVDPRPEDWRGANDEVGRLGGHSGHLKPAAKPPAPAAPSTTGSK
jgi:hypothetical protein